MGLDENVKEGGYSFKNFTGAPHWAVDITPKKSFEKEANEITEKFVAAGLKFSEGMRAMSFPPDVGKSQRTSNMYCAISDHSLKPPNMRKVDIT